MKRRWWIALACVILPLIFLIAGYLYIAWLGQGEVRRWSFESSLIPSLEIHLKETGQFPENFGPSDVGRLALAGRNIDPETTGTILEGSSGIMVIPGPPSDSNIPCIWYDKQTGKFSRLQITPWE